MNDPTTDPRPLIAAADHLVEVARNMHDALDALGGLQCVEVEAIAGVLLAAGAPDVAENIIEAHASGDDDPDDQHHDIYLTLHAGADR